MRATAKEARAWGLTAKKRPKKYLARGQKTEKLTAAQIVFRVRCGQHGLVNPEFEYRFHPERKWAFDAAWPHSMLACEIQGGLWNHGRHTQGAALLREYEKLNEACIAGWRLVFVTPEQVDTG